MASFFKLNDKVWINMENVSIVELVIGVEEDIGYVGAFEVRLADGKELAFTTKDKWANNAPVSPTVKTSMKALGEIQFWLESAAAGGGEGGEHVS
jgi:hypothetical protein